MSLKEQAEFRAMKEHVSILRAAVAELTNRIDALEAKKGPGRPKKDAA